MWLFKIYNSPYSLSFKDNTPLVWLCCEFVLLIQSHFLEDFYLICSSWEIFSYLLGSADAANTKQDDRDRAEYRPGRWGQRALTGLFRWTRHAHIDTTLTFLTILQLPQPPHHLLLPQVFSIPKKQSQESTKMAVKCSEKTHLKSGWPFSPGRSRSFIFWQDLVMESSFPENYHLKL